MYQVIDSPIIRTNLQSPVSNLSGNSTKYHRYSSVDESANSKNQWKQSSSRIVDIRQEHKQAVGQKTERTQKQRVHSQKKLTLTSANLPNGSFNNVPIQVQNSCLMNARQTYEGFKRNLQLKSNNLLKTTVLQKKGKYSSMKNSQTSKLPSTSNIRIESNPLIQEKQNEYEQGNSAYQSQKQRSKGLIQAKTNNYYQSNPEAFYNHQRNYTAPSSPVYMTQIKPMAYLQNNSFESHINSNNIVKFFQQKIQHHKEMTNKVLLQNSMRIKQLEGLLLHNKHQIQSKSEKIRQLELNLMLNQNSCKNTAYQSPANTIGHYSSLSSHYRQSSDVSRLQPLNNPSNQCDTFIISKIDDLQKKISVISKWSNDSQNQINEKIDRINNFLQNFVTVKFHNLRFTIKTFINKNQQKVASLEEKADKIKSIVQLNQVEAFEGLLQKNKGIVKILHQISTFKVEARTHLEDMKTTMNTAVSSLKGKQMTQFDVHHNMLDSRDLNESFWNHLQDVYLQESKHQEQSFTDDSFSYAPEATKCQFNSNNYSSVNEFALGSFPSFSKFSFDMNLCKQQTQSAKSSYVQTQSSCMQTLRQISKYRQGPVSIYLDPNGCIRYKGSESYIFDRKGNILKPSESQLQYCFVRNWIAWG